VAHPQIAAFSRMAKENAKPTRLLAGQGTLLSRTMHDIRYDAVNDEMYVTNPFAQAIMVFRGGANGEEKPIRIIQGPHTRMFGTDRLDVDPVHNEILVPAGNRVFVYPRTGNGDVAPLRVIRVPRLRGIQALAVDPVHDLIVAGSASEYGSEAGPQGGGKGAIVILSRTADGDVKPLRVIQGPKTRIFRIEQSQVYSPKGWIVATQPGRASDEEPEGAFVGIWSINDNGDVPPRWFLAGSKSTLKKPRGVALDPKHKELIVADMRLNALLTFYFPEMF
jgi:hypothetical protein